MSVTALTDSNFEQVIESNDIVVIDFWAQWCEPCKTFAEIFAHAATQHPDIAFASVDIETETTLAADFNVRSVPLLIIMRQQVVVFMESGVIPESGLTDLLTQARAIDMQQLHQQIHEQQVSEQ